MPSTRHTPVKTRTPWPPGTFCSMVYIMRWRVQRSRVGCVQALAPAARDGLRESRCSCARVVAMRACGRQDATLAPSKF